MATENAYKTLTVVASQDLTGHQFKAVGLHGGVASTSASAIGILRTKKIYRSNGFHTYPNSSFLRIC